MAPLRPFWGIPLVVVGLFWPWLHRSRGAPDWKWQHELVLRFLEVLADPSERHELGCLSSAILVSAVALPALWCSRPRGHVRARLVASYVWIGLLLAVALWVGLVGRPLDLGRRWDWHPSLGYFCSAVGALLLGLLSIAELHAYDRHAARWRERPGRDQASRELDREALGRLSYPLRRLACEARALRALLLPLRPFGDEQSHRLTEIAGRLRTLDAQGCAELRDHGLEARALLQALVPTEPRDETCLDEALRVDAALTKLEGVALRRVERGAYR